MAVRIWKYNVPGHCEGPIRQVLGTKIQYGKPVVWVLLDDDIKEIRALDFYTVGTGWELEDDDARAVRNSAYIGTVKDEEGYVWHIFCVAVNPVEKDKNKGGKDAVSASAIDEASDEADDGGPAAG